MSTIADQKETRTKVLDFGLIKAAVTEQFNKMVKSTTELFVVDTDKEEIWKLYLSSFPSGTNPVYRERTDHDCTCCRHFIQRVGNVVAITPNGSIETIWDIELEGAYGVVARKLADYVRDRKVTNVFRHYEPSAGVDKSFELSPGHEAITWRHFHVALPAQYVNKVNLDSYLSDTRSNFDVLKRSLKEMTLEAGEVVLDLIKQGSLYRGEEHVKTVEMFVKLKKEYDAVPEGSKEEFCWLKSVELKGVSKIRNTVIGTLISDISEGEDSLESAVKSFESKVAPTNYKRPTALVTQTMVKKAQETVKELGFENSLARRFAVTEDVTVNNVIFADRSVRPAMGGDVFDTLAKSVTSSGAPKNLDKVEEINIKDFIENVVPKASSIELLVENKHHSNLMSLIAPQDKTAPTMFKWNNNFSWAYKGEVADGLKEHVKKAGGNVLGEFRCSLAWYSRNDMDIHLIEPDKNMIYFGRKSSNHTSGQLDVDNRVGGTKTNPAIENIYYQKASTMKEGNYTVYVRNFGGSNTKEPGFDLELEFKGNLYTISYQKPVTPGQQVICLVFDYDEKNGITFNESKCLPFGSAVRDCWGIKTETFQKVSMIMNSPNHWDGNETGNKHYFFILEGCNSGEDARGFFNEFLKEELNEHRKVFEIVGSKMRAEKSDRQLSGLGFSSTVRNHAYFKVSGSFNRIVKVLF